MSGPTDSQRSDRQPVVYLQRRIYGDFQSTAEPIEVTDAMVERFRASLWASWGADRQTTDWPTGAQLRDALLVTFGQKREQANG